MKKIILTSIVVLSFLSAKVSAQCEEVNLNKVLLVGDSWAFFMGSDQTFNTIFQRWGHSNYKYFTNGILSENGAETVDFMQPGKQTEIQAQLDAQPNIEVVHLSLGGNDVLGDWNVNFTQFQTDSLIDTVLTRLLTIVDFIKEARPGIQIVWSGYAYPNFGQVLADAGALQTIHPFYGTWQSMGFPTFQQLNDILNEVSNIVEAYAALDPQIDFVNATGLMQHTFGQATNLSVPPGGSYPPFVAPLPEGYPDYPSPKASMRNYGLFLDCFHLSATGYRDFISYQTQKFYHKFLMGDQYFLSQGGSAEGSVAPNGVVEPNVLKMGALLEDEFRPIITFNTSELPDAGVSSASLFLRRESLTGINPIGEGLQLKISNGFIGTTINVEAGDFGAMTNASIAPCYFGSSAANGHWIRIDLPEYVLPLIDNSGTVQFMLVAPQLAEGIITFSNASNPEFAPVLSVNHNVVTVVEELFTQSESNLLIYPNPTKGTVFVKSITGSIREIQILNIAGNVIQRYGANTSSLDMSILPAGIYLIKVTTDEGVVVKKVVKN
jgi:lysophospholipase L1-like esterase